MSVVISHVAAVSCIQLPVFESTDATQRLRKSGWRSGRHAEGGVTSSGAASAADRIPLLCRICAGLAPDRRGVAAGRQTGGRAVGSRAVVIASWVITRLRDCVIARLDAGVL